MLFKSNTRILKKGLSMQIKITFKSTDHSDAIEQHVRAEIAKFESLFKRDGGPISVEVIVQAHHEKHYATAEFLIHSSDYRAVAHAQGPDMYVIIHEAARKAFQEIIKQKGKLSDKQDHRHQYQEFDNQDDQDDDEDEA